jgi:cell division protein ZapA
MTQVPVLINGRAYEVACNAGEEADVQQAGREISRRVDELVRSVGQLGDTRLLLLTSLHVAHELASAHADVHRLSETHQHVQAVSSPDLAAAVERLAKRIEAIAAQLEAA